LPVPPDTSAALSLQIAAVLLVRRENERGKD